MQGAKFAAVVETAAQSLEDMAGSVSRVRQAVWDEADAHFSANRIFSERVTLRDGTIDVIVDMSRLWARLMSAKCQGIDVPDAGQLPASVTVKVRVGHSVEQVMSAVRRGVGAEGAPAGLMEGALLTATLM